MPARLGRYAVRRRIGSGGFATVWLAYDEQLDSPVAIKVLAENWTEDSHVRQRFLEEGRYLRKVESPHVVTVYDAGSLEDDRPYLVMSYADQGTLADRLETDGLTVGQASEVIRQVGEGLHALHQRGILHRDIKPANVLFRTADAHSSGNDGVGVRAMVGDLGLGKALDVSSRLTMIAGTPSFVAPEQAQGEHLDARADQYSLAALTYLLLAGRPPYAHSTLAAAASPRIATTAGPTCSPTSPSCGWPSATRPRARFPSAGCRWTPSSPSPATSPRWSPQPTTCRIRCRRSVAAGPPPYSRWCCSLPVVSSGSPCGGRGMPRSRSPTPRAPSR
jgi:serine/threonine protein kinase